MDSLRVPGEFIRLLHGEMKGIGPKSSEISPGFGLRRRARHQPLAQERLLLRRQSLYRRFNFNYRTHAKILKPNHWWTEY